MDKIDHNPTATTATISFHGTSASVFQHPTKEDKGEERGQLKFGEEKVKIVPELPDSFTNVRPPCLPRRIPNYDSGTYYYYGTRKPVSKYFHGSKFGFYIVKNV
ncbi:hypothetical protein Pcinc_018008 [Petrolisthes cinctipes]|uniref:Uncharacterized protein n=1 Tax=Petrolisthes cinctipes TaxID=88211 RepID=A0AAE1FN26_PETCI|nr:hypothetical protein Pcinc_018008 [Petrolisthes cinctipes]